MPQDDAQARASKTKEQWLGGAETRLAFASTYFISFHLRGVKMKSTRESLNAATSV